MLKRRISAAALLAALLALVAGDVWIASFRAWWYHHSLTGSIVSSLLVLGVAGLIVDEIVARRQLRERATSVAVQAMILYGQARPGGHPTPCSSKTTIPTPAMRPERSRACF